MTAFLRYDPSVETIAHDEAEIFSKIARTFAEMGEQVQQQEGRALRVSHAKPTALLDAELVVADALPLELAQGLAAGPGRYQVRVRFAQGPGEILHDRVSTHRGMAVKIIGIEGEPISENDEPGMQDFVLEGGGAAFINSNAEAFLANLRAGVSHAPSLPEAAKNAVSKVARATEATLEAVGLHSKTLAFFSHPPLHPLAESYYSQAPMRWGDYVAKVALVPTQSTLDGLVELTIEHRDDHDAFRTAMQEHFATSGADFELRVQLATDLAETPVEDAAKEWPQDDNPYRTVATLTIVPQSAWSPEREAEFDRLSFRPAHSLAAHRPLGQVMRARLFVYGKLADMRRQATYTQSPV